MNNGNMIRTRCIVKSGSFATLTIQDCEGASTPVTHEITPAQAVELDRAYAEAEARILGQKAEAKPVETEVQIG